MRSAMSPPVQDSATRERLALLAQQARRPRRRGSPHPRRRRARRAARGSPRRPPRASASASRRRRRARHRAQVVVGKGGAEAEAHVARARRRRAARRRGVDSPMPKVRSSVARTTRPPRGAPRSAAAPARPSSAGARAARRACRRRARGPLEQEARRGADRVRQDLGALGEPGLASRCSRSSRGRRAEEGRGSSRARASSSTSARPKACASTSVVRSSRVGPSPPDTSTTSLRSAARRKASIMSAGSSLHRGVETGLDVEAEQPIGQEGLVRIDDLAAQQLVADREDLGAGRVAHAPPSASAAPTASSAEDAGQDVVHHHARAARGSCARPSRRRRLPDVEHPEQRRIRSRAASRERGSRRRARARRAGRA